MHREYAPRYEEAGSAPSTSRPAAVGPAVIPPVNWDEHLDVTNVNMITCGGQATIPMVAAVSRRSDGVVRRDRGEGRVHVAGPGTRANIDEFTRTTARGGLVDRWSRGGKAIIILNPADPPMIMRDTIFCACHPRSTSSGRDRASCTGMESIVQKYVPGYRLLQEPQIDDPSPATQGQLKVSIFVEVEGAGDYLPPYAGNLDIMTAAAARVGEQHRENTGG